jgi:hypothetical protein
MEEEVSRYSPAATNSTAAIPLPLPSRARRLRLRSRSSQLASVLASCSPPSVTWQIGLWLRNLLVTFLNYKGLGGRVKLFFGFGGRGFRVLGPTVFT